MPKIKRQSRIAVAGLTLVAIMAVPAFLLTRGACAQAEPGASKESAQAKTPELGCEKEIKVLRIIFKRIPDDFRARSGKELREAQRDMNACIPRLESLIESCDPVPGDAYFMLARLRVSFSQKHRNDLVNVKKLRGADLEGAFLDYNKKNLALCEKAFEIEKARLKETGEKRSSYYYQVAQLMGDIYLTMRNYELALGEFLDVVNSAPDTERARAATCALNASRCYLQMVRPSEGIPFVRKSLKRFNSEPGIPYFYEALWDLLIMEGDIAGMLDWCDDVDRLFPKRLEKEDLTKLEKEGLRRYYGWSGFHRGYTLFASGEFSGAKEAFQAHIQRMDEWEKEYLRDEDLQLPVDLRLYQDRSKDNVVVLEDRVGKPPPIDLDLGDHWLTPNRVLISENEGKAVAVLFRRYHGGRSRAVFRALDEFAGKDPENRAFAAVHFFRGTTNQPGQLAKLEDEIVSIGIEHAAVGMDPDASNKTIFREFKAMVGTATLMIFDKKGHLAWWQQDPRYMDLEFIKAIWTRIAEAEG